MRGNQVENDDTETPTQSTNGAKYPIFGMVNPLLVFRSFCPKDPDDVQHHKDAMNVRSRFDAVEL